MKNNSLRSHVRYFFKQTSSLFLDGLLALLPLTLTFAVFRVSFRLLKGWMEPIHTIMPSILLCIPHSEILLVIICIFLMGIVLRFFILRRIGHTLEKVIFRIPLIRPVYTGIKQLVHAFNPQDTHSFKRVVLVEFPRKGVYSVGFVTSEVPAMLTPTHETQKLICIFVPTTPNPTTGFFIFLPEEEVIIIDLTRQEAMALIISGGIIQPERFTKTTAPDTH